MKNLLIIGPMPDREKKSGFGKFFSDQFLIEQASDKIHAFVPIGIVSRISSKSFFRKLYKYHFDNKQIRQGFFTYYYCQPGWKTDLRAKSLVRRCQRHGVIRLDDEVLGIKRNQRIINHSVKY